MIVFAAKVSVKKIVAGVLAAGAVVAGIVLLLPTAENAQTTVGEVGLDSKLKTNEQRVALLESYGWYPTAQQQEEGAGCDEYMVGKTVGLGGIALWDGEKEVKLTATKGRTARVGHTKSGSYAEMIAYGVPYQEDTVDISIRIDMTRRTRDAQVTATELSGKPVMFLTGVNYHHGQTVKCGDGFIFAWGVHPADVAESPVPVGAGMFFRPSDFGPMEVTEDMVRIVSKPTSSICTTVVAASTKEAELNTVRRFESYMVK